MIDQPQYLYVLSNTSYPGLLKIGHTSRDPASRARELSSTGVPTPFEIRLVLVVRSGSSAEAEAHRELHRYRKHRNREFFEISEEEAIKIILDNVEFERVDWRHTRTNSSVGALVHLEVSEKLESIRSARAEIRKELDRLGVDTTMLPFEEKTRLLEARLKRLGERPVLKKPSSLGELAQLVYQPFPIGWAVWILAWYLWSHERYIAVAVIASGFLLGGVSSSLLKRRESRHVQSLKPWTEIDEELSEIQTRLRRFHELRDSDENLADQEAKLAASLSDTHAPTWPSSEVGISRTGHARQFQLFDSGPSIPPAPSRPSRRSRKKRMLDDYRSDNLHTVEWEGFDYVYASDEHASSAIEKFKRFGPPWSPFGLQEVRRSKSPSSDSGPVY
jgi:hypothetical protein